MEQELYCELYFHVFVMLYLSLPQTQSSVLRSGRVELSIWAETNAVDRPEMSWNENWFYSKLIKDERVIVTFEIFDLLSGLVIVLVQLEVFASGDENTLKISKYIII